jgi:hypothetical protein
MSAPNWWGDWRPILTPHTGNLQPTDLLECTSIVGGLPVNTAITGAQIIAAASGGSGLTVGTTAITSGTIGRVLFQGTGNVLQQSANLFWDNTNNRLGIGTSTPGRAITVTTNNVPTIEIISTGTTASTDFSVLSLQTTAKTWNIGTGGTTTGLNAVFYIDSPTSTATPFKILSNGTTNLLNTTINNLSTVTNFNIENNNASGFSVLNIKNNATSGKTYQIAVGGNTTSSAFANNLYFADSVSGTRMTIYSSGNLGINTTTDAGFKLDVNGTARVQTSLAVTTGKTFSAYTSSAANDALKLEVSNLGAVFGVQNSNASGFSGIEYLSNAGVPRVFTGFNNGNGQEFRFNNFASGGYIDFLIGSTSGLRIANTRNILINTTTDAGFRLDVNGTARIQSKLSVGTPTAASAVMEVTSTTQGFLPPRMTNAQMLAIAAPAAGLIVYDTTNNKHCGYNGTAWQNFY